MSTDNVFVRDAPLYVESDTGRIAPYPRNPWIRWAVRLLGALPFAGLALWFEAASGDDWSGTANGELAHRFGEQSWSGTEVTTLAELYPTITSLLSLVIPGGALGLSLAGAFAGGMMLQLVLQAMQRKGLRLALRSVFIATLAVTPMFAYVVTTSFEAAIGLTFFGLGMIDLVRFVTYANTQAGFRAGMLFACAAFSDSTLILVALVAGLAASFIVRSREGARLANVLVVVFPTIALLGSVMALGVAFGVGPLVMIRGDLRWDAVRADAVVGLLLSPSGLLYLAPTAVIVVTALVLRHPGVGLVAILMTAVILMSYILGLTPPGVAGINYLLMLLLAVAIVPVPVNLRDALLVSTTSVALGLIGWLQAFDTATVKTWMAVLGGAS